MADVKWIKVMTNIFDDEKVQLIESLPGADSIITIWFKLLCLAGKTNNDGIFLLSEKIPYTEEMLASIFHRDIQIVRMALKTFEQFGMIEIINNIITIPNWEKHQNIEGMEKVREQTRQRTIEYRKRQKQKALEVNSDVSCDVTVTDGDETEEERRKKKEDKEINNSCSNSSQRFPAESFEMKCVELLIRSCLEVMPNSKVPVTQADKEKWAVDIERMKRLDQRTEEDILQSLDYAISDSFWKPNIRSAKKFRDKFETLYIQSQRSKPKQQSQQNQPNKVESNDRFICLPQSIRLELESSEVIEGQSINIINASDEQIAVLQKYKLL